MRVWYTGFKSGFCTQIQKIVGPTLKKHVWYMRFKWGLKSQLEFYVDSMPIFSLVFHLFLNPSRIQIRTQFFCGSQFITVTGPTFFFSPHFLSLLQTSLLLSCSRPLQPVHCSLLFSHYRAPLSHFNQNPLTSSKLDCNISQPNLHIAEKINHREKVKMREK